MGKRILVAMSGGIDSTVAAMLLQEQGNEIAGVTFRTFDSVDESCGRAGGGYCSIDSITAARQVAEKLGFEHHTADFRSLFRECVIQNFIDEYMRGRTPNPCVVCNSEIKWGALLNKADELGCTHIATGHYARIAERNGHLFLRNAADTHKDQTYFLWKLTEKNLSRTIFPLGDFSKSEVRQMAAERGFVNLSEKSESQEICFIPDNDYRRFLRENVSDFTEKVSEGDFLNSDDEPIGRHAGFPFYTIGQRKGLKVAFGTPKYVTKINAAANTVTLGDRDDLLRRMLHASECRFIDTQMLTQNPEIMVRIRYKSPAIPAHIDFQGSEAELRFSTPVRGITPGQSAVFYQDDCVAGGGIID